jgi:hypothetical protein
VDLDSIDLGSYPLPWTLAAGVRYRVTPTVDFAVQGMYRTWSGADSLVLAGGGAGAKDVFDVSAGVEWVRSVTRPSHLPLRLGVRYATIPVLVEPDAQPSEVALTIGSGARFARDRGGIDFSLERVWRSDGTGRSESAWLLFGGVSIRP